MGDFSKSRVGDKCWSIELGDCVVKVINHDDKGIKVCNDCSCLWYNLDGYIQYNAALSLFHSKPEFTDPPPAKRMKKASGWLNIYKRDYGNMDYLVSDIHKTKDSADRQISPSLKRVACVPIEFEVEDDD